jgi:lipoate synthase
VVISKDIAQKKAELIAKGRIYIPKGIVLPYPLDRSTAGPEAGSLLLTLSFEETRVKLIKSQRSDEIFSLLQQNSLFSILKNNALFLENVKIIPTIYHAPHQAFLNLENRCIYNCAFCTLSKNNFLQTYTDKRFVKLILSASSRHDFSSIALTSGIYPDNETVIQRMCTIITIVKEQLPQIPIGVEPIIFTKKDLLSLRKAGAEEIKINLQIPDRELFSKLCPDFRYDDILRILKQAVAIFGRGKVATNIIFGLGESDESIKNTLQILTSCGIVPTLRKVRINQNNSKKIKRVLSKIPMVSDKRILNLALVQKKFLISNRLTTKSFKTMCHACGCCDLVPFYDV